MTQETATPTVAARTAGELTEALRAALGDNLHSLILYGSAVRGDFVPGTSDLNVLIVLAQSTPEAHAAVGDAIRGRSPRVEPFVLGLDGLDRSRRVFAIKFRNIARNHRVLHGHDVLAGFDPEPQLLRFLAEQSLRTLRLRHKHAYVTFGDDRPRFTAHLSHVLPAVHVALAEALRCDGIDVPRERAARGAVYERAFGADVSILADLAALRARPHTLSKSEVDDYHARLFRLLSGAAAWMEGRWSLPNP
jgi:hypothetical protein